MRLAIWDVENEEEKVALKVGLLQLHSVFDLQVNWRS